MTLLTGSDTSVINSDTKKKNYSDHSSYSYSGIDPKERALNFARLHEDNFHEDNFHEKVEETFRYSILARSTMGPWKT